MSVSVKAVSSRRRRGRRAQTTFGFSPSSSTCTVAINTTLVSSEAYYWIPLMGVTAEAIMRPSSLLIRAACSTPTNLRFIAQLSDDNTTWREIWSSNTGLVGTNSQLIRLRIPKTAGRAAYARIGAVSSGTPTLCGQATFVYYDPV